MVLKLNLLCCRSVTKWPGVALVTELPYYFYLKKVEKSFKDFNL